MSFQILLQLACRDLGPTAYTLLQDPSPFMERLNIDSAELDPRPLSKSCDSLFGSSNEQSDTSDIKTGVVGSMISKVWISLMPLAMNS